MIKRALILGGTSGLGLEIAKLSYGDGIMPILVGRSAKPVGKTHGFEHITCDLALPDAPQLILRRMSDVSTVKYLVVAGGELLPGKVVEQDPAAIDHLWQVNLMAPKRLVRDFTAARRSGYQLVTVASTSATIPRTNETEYASVQAARRQWSLSFHHELAELCLGSRNLVVCPGGMATEAWAKVGKEPQNFMQPEQVASIIYASMTNQAEGLCQELRIERNPDGTPNVLPLVTHFG